MNANLPYAPERCERCGAVAPVRTASFFTEDDVCMACLAQESRFMGRLRANGVHVAILAESGYVPTHNGAAAPKALRHDWKRPAVPAQPGRRITAAEVRAALQHLRARSALLRIPPGKRPPGCCTWRTA